MTRSFALALAVLSFSLTAAVSAQPIVVTGMVTDHDAKPIPGTRVTVYPYESPYAAARALFEGQEPSPLAQATADAAGRFRLTLREVDFYSVEVSAPGFLTLYRELAPLVSDLELEPAELEAATEVVVRVQNPDGSPVLKEYPGAFIRIIGFDNTRQVQCISFIAYKPPSFTDA